MRLTIMAKGKRRLNLRQLDIPDVGSEDPEYSEDLSPLLELIADGRLTSLGADIETRPVAPFVSALDPWEGKVRLIGVMCEAGSYLVDCEERPDQAQLLMDTLGKYQPWVTAHNAWFDCLHLRWHFGTVLERVRCSLIAHRVKYAGQLKRADLSTVAVDCGIQPHDKAKQLSCFAGPVSVAQKNYCVRDAGVAFRAEETLAQTAAGHILQLEYGCIPAFVEMGFHGLQLDFVQLARLERQVEVALHRLVRRLETTAIQRAFTQRWIASSHATKQQELRDWILANDESADDGTPSSILPPEPLYVSPRKRASIAALLERTIDLDGDIEKNRLDEYVMIQAEMADPSGPWREIRRYRKLLFTRAYLRTLRERSFEGRVRAKYQQMARSGNGRVSISQPNLANSARQQPLLEEAGIEPTRTVFSEEGMLDLDLPGAHIRLAASRSGDKRLMSAIRAGDIHSLTASAMARMSGHDWSPELIAQFKGGGHADSGEMARLRQAAKEVIYSYCNGSGPDRLTETLLTGLGRIPVPAYGPAPSADAWLTATSHTYPQLHQSLVAASNSPMVHSIGGRVVDGARLSPMSRRMQYLMAGESLWIKGIIWEAWRELRKHGLRFLGFQHDEAMMHGENSRFLTEALSAISLEVSHALMPNMEFTRSDFDPEKMRIRTLEDKK